MCIADVYQYLYIYIYTSGGHRFHRLHGQCPVKAAPEFDQVVFQPKWCGQTWRFNPHDRDLIILFDYQKGFRQQNWGDFPSKIGGGFLELPKKRENWSRNMGICKLCKPRKLAVNKNRNMSSGNQTWLGKVVSSVQTWFITGWYSCWMFHCIVCLLAKGCFSLPTIFDGGTPYSIRSTALLGFFWWCVFPSDETSA